MQTERLVFRQARNGLVSIALRTHDMGGTDYHPLVLIEFATAAQMAGGHTGIHFAHRDPDCPDGLFKVVPVIERIPGATSGSHVWQLRVGSEVASRIDSRDGQRKTIRLSDETVDMLAKMATVTFEPGQPDWPLREVEMLEERATIAENAALTARERAQQARTALEQRAAEPEAEEDLRPIA